MSQCSELKSILPNKNVTDLSQLSVQDIIKALDRYNNVKHHSNVIYICNEEYSKVLQKLQKDNKNQILHTHVKHIIHYQGNAYMLHTINKNMLSVTNELERLDGLLVCPMCCESRNFLLACP